MYVDRCTVGMRKRELTRRLSGLGWWKERDGRRHEKWTNGRVVTTVPRHVEINEQTASAILRLAETNPGRRRR